MLCFCCDSSSAQKLVKLQKAMNDRELKSLSLHLAQSEVMIERLGLPQKHYRFTKKRLEFGKGVSLSKRLILTSTSWLQIRPDESEINIKLSCPYSPLTNHVGQQNHSFSVKAKIIEISKKQGWALLESEQEVSCKGIDLAPLNQQHLEQSFYVGHHLYMYEPKPLNPAQMTLIGLAPMPMDYYWYSSGQGSPGSGLYNHQGQLVTLVAHSGFNPNFTLPQTLILPPNAMQMALDRAKVILGKTNGH